MRFARNTAIAAFLASPVAAQVTLDQADAVMDSRDKELTAFQERLSDPDPDRALAVLKLLITEGDVEQRRLAIRHGLQSTDMAIRATTVRAILDSQPTLVIRFVPVSEETDNNYANAIRQSNGVLSEDNSAEVLQKVNGYDEAEECWTSGSYKTCFARMRGDVVSLFYGNSWGNYTLNGEGQLTGQQAINNNLTNATVDLYE